ncbi:MAG: hypothetical protein V8S22_05320 [Lachnospiraceae bacterium]
MGTTENVILAAVLADGVTVLSGAAKEPEIAELCRFLRGKGARIEGDGTDTIRVEGVTALQDSEFIIGSDRIVAGTYSSEGFSDQRKDTSFRCGSRKSWRSPACDKKDRSCGEDRSGKEIFLDAGEAFLPVGKVTTTLSGLSNGSSVGASFRHDGGTGEK